MIKLISLSVLSLFIVSACVPPAFQATTNTNASVNVNATMEQDGDAMMDDDTDAMEGDKMDNGAIMEKKDGDAMVEVDATVEVGGDAMEKDGDAMMEKKEDSSASGDVTFTGTVLAGSDAPYIEFNESDFAKAKAAGKNIMLYFYANWCPTCKAEEPQIFNAFEVFTAADNVVGFRVNFKDTETSSFEKQLATDYGVRLQHTRVFLRGDQYLSTTAATPWVTLDYLENVRAEFGIN